MMRVAIPSGTTIPSPSPSPSTLVRQLLAAAALALFPLAAAASPSPPVQAGDGGGAVVGAIGGDGFRAGGGGWGGGGGSEPDRNGMVTGRIHDAVTGKPVAFAYIHVEQLERSALSDAQGRFDLGRLPAGSHTLSIHRIGYRSAIVDIDVTADAPIELRIGLLPEALRGEEVVVTGSQAVQGGALDHSTVKLVGDELRVNLSQTLAQTLSRLPGFSERSMGGTPSRPVIRGLGGERVVILQDGQRSGDVSAQSADHAVSIDPIGADELQILRGAAALAYSPNAVGGIVNQVDNLIPATRATSVIGGLGLQADGSTGGLAGTADFMAPLGPLTFKAGWTMRGGGNLRTADGRLDNTAHTGRTGLLGMGSREWDARTLLPTLALSLNRDWGYAGAATSTFASRYGIPPDPDGGHPLGVDVEMQKWRLQGRTEIQPLQPGWIELGYGSFLVNQYNHKELEAGGAVGTEFGQVTADLTAKIRHRPFAPAMASGWLGMWVESLDYAVRGAGTPDTRGLNAAVFLIESARFNRWSLDAGMRLDMGSRRPEIEDPDSRIGHIRRRDFLTWAGALTLSWTSRQPDPTRSDDPRDGAWTTSLTLIRTARIPGMEELYSEGPHLASYSYEIGNPDLSPETALTGELSAGWSSERAALQATLFHSAFDRYLYPRNTGRRNLRYPSLFDYQYSAASARFQGVEASLMLRPLPRLRLTADASLVRAEREGGGDEDGMVIDGVGPSRGDWIDLPMIPPPSGNLTVEWLAGRTTATARMVWAARQDRVGEFETPTDGYVRFDATFGTRFMHAGRLHTLGLSALNLTDRIYRHHLSRVKEFHPEAGRHLQLLYRLYF